jgi:hypothetical protein
MIEHPIFQRHPGPARLVKLASFIRWMQISALCFGFLGGSLFSGDWCIKSSHLLVIMLAAWIGLLLPEVLDATAICWASKKDDQQDLAG